MEISAFTFEALSAWGTWAAVACAIAAVWSQNRAATRLTCLQMFNEIAAQYSSPEMHAARRRIAMRLLSEPKSLDHEDSLLVFYENLAILVRKNLLDRDLTWNTFSHDVPRYWSLLREYVLWSRETSNSPALYEEFEQLARDLVARKRSPLGTAVAPDELNESSLRSFLLYESRIGSDGTHA